MRQRSESSSRRGAGLRHDVRRMFWEGASRDRESVGRKCSQVLRARETQYFQQFKLIDLCVKDIRRRTEEYFACDAVPRCIEESLAVCERELEDRIRSLRTLIGASTLVRDLEAAGELCKRAGDVRRYKLAVSEAMEERVRRQNLSVVQGRERRLDGLLVEGVGGSRVSKERKPEETRMCYGCGERGHLKMNCKGSKKDKGVRG